MQSMSFIIRIFLKALRIQNDIFQKIAMRGMVWRGFSKKPIHPKHLFDEKRNSTVSEMFTDGIAFLDIGSGSGSECLRAKGKGANLAVGVDHNEASLDVARLRASEQFPESDSIKFYALDLEEAKLPFEDNTFDLVNFSNVLEHLHNRIEILREIQRVKKPDGKLLISIPNRNTSWKRLQRKFGLDSRDDDDHKIEYDEADLNQELNSAGLHIHGPLKPIVPSFPWHGIMASSALVSPSLYRYFQSWKRDYVERKPEESVGWEFEVR